MNFEDLNIDELLVRFNNYFHKSSNEHFDIIELVALLHHFIVRNDTESIKMIVGITKMLYPDTLDSKKMEILGCLIDNKVKQAQDLIRQIEVEDNEIVMFRITILLKLNHVSKALDEAQNYLTKHDFSQSAYCDLIQCFTTEGRHKHALNFAKEGIQKYPDSIEILFQMGVCYDMADKTTKAIQCYKRVIEIDPFEDSAWFNLAQSYSRIEKYNEALDAINYGLAIQPHDILSLNFKADILTLLDRHQEAIQTLLDIIDEGGENSEIGIKIAANYLADENFEKALEWIERAENNTTNKGRILLQKFDILMIMERFEDCRKTLDQCFEAGIPLWIIMSKQGTLESYLGNSQKSLEYMLKAAKLEPNAPSIWAKCSLAAWETGDYKKSKKYIQKCFAIDPLYEYGEALWAACNYKLGHNKLFLESFEYLSDNQFELTQFLNLCPEFEPNISLIIDAIKSKRDYHHFLVYTAGDEPASTNN